MAILVIAEKPSVAMTIAKVLNATRRQDGYMEGGGYVVSWCYGHLVGLADPEAYDAKYAEKPWRLEHLPMIPGSWKFTVHKDCKDQYAVLKRLMGSAEIGEVVCATDAGREGEVIFRYVYITAGCRKPFKRLWISSLEESAIREGFSRLRPGKEFDNLYASGFSRARADWLVGMNGTRLFSALYRSFLSVGRVQTPTLAMIVERDAKIKSFAKERYYTVNLDCGGRFAAVSERIENQAAALAVQSDCKGKTATVTALKKEKKSESPPKLYDLTTLQRESNKLYGFTAQQSLDCVQKLYEKKLCSYPRTDSQFLTDDMADTAERVIELITARMPFARRYAGHSPDIQRVLNSKKVSDHYALIPTGEIKNCNFAELPDNERKILFLIAHRLLCATGQAHTYEDLRAVISCAGHEFTAKGKTILTDGWKGVEKAFKGEGKPVGGEALQTFSAYEGETFENCSAKLSEKWTEPPKHYTEDTLLSAMETAGNSEYEKDADIEKKGLGTPATRAGTIETLIGRGYIVREKKNLLATDKGTTLIRTVPESIKSPSLTVAWETGLQKLERGEGSEQEFMRGIIGFTQKLIADNSKAAEGANGAFTPPKSTVIIGKCPKCGKNVVELPKSYSCESGREGCGFVLWKSQYYKENALSVAQAKKLLLTGRTDKLSGFKSKAGKEYSAVLALTPEFTVKLEF